MSSSKSAKDWQLDDEHLLIATFCQALQDNSTGSGMIQLSDAAMKFERDIDMEQVLYQLNLQNNLLSQEYEALSKELSKGTPEKNKTIQKNNLEQSNPELKPLVLEDKQRAVNSAADLHQTEDNKSNEGIVNNKMDINSVDEAAKLRQHTNRMETRISMLVDHNKQLEARLARLRQLVQQADDVGDGSLSGSRFGTLRSRVVRATSLQSQSQGYDSGINIQNLGAPPPPSLFVGLVKPTIDK